MDWDILQKKDLYQVRDFILPKEWMCVSFSSRFKNMSAKLLTNTRDLTILAHYTRDKKTIKETIMLTRSGLILPLLDHHGEQRKNGILREYLSSLDMYMKKLHSVMGLFHDVSEIETYLPMEASVHIDYYLMSITEKSLIKPKKPVDNDFTIKEAKPKDAERLYSLQKKYELEEVFVNPSHFNPRVCLHHLKEMAKSEIILYAERKGIPVAKAQTNARGYSVDQIGGVYTLQEEREKGYAGYLMYLLLKRIFKKKLIASLFVKKKNTPAINLYRNLGFTFMDNFKIAYFFDR
jgi:ribosomal protein S18 acetylase RimI-like enzyme